MIHVEKLAYQLIDCMLGLDFDVDCQKECKKEQNTTRNGDQFGNCKLTSMIIRGSVRNTILKHSNKLLFFHSFSSIGCSFILRNTFLSVPFTKLYFVPFLDREPAVPSFLFYTKHLKTPQSYPN